MTAQRRARIDAARYDLWERLNRAPMEVYLRFQRMTARHRGGKWLRGIVIDVTGVKFHFE